MSIPGWRGGKSGRGRIDARPQNDPAVQAGLRNIHRDLQGNVTGAVTPEGKRIGTRKAPGSEPSVSPNTVARQQLFNQMDMAGPGGITPAMQQRAAQLGVDGAGWRRAMAKIGPAVPVNQAATRPMNAPARAVAARPSAPQPIAQPAAPAIPAARDASGARINRLTGKPFGWLPDPRAVTPAGPPAPLPAVGPPKPAGTTLPDAIASLRQARESTTALLNRSRAPLAQVGPPAPLPQAGPPAPAVSFAPPAMPANPVAVGAAPAVSRMTKAPAVAGPAFTTPEAVRARQVAQADAKQKMKRASYNAAWNAQPDLPGADRTSIANKMYKSARTFLGGNSY